jgi:hypothetical protein
VIGRTIVLQSWLGLVFEFRNNALREHLAEFHAPLVKGVDLPHDGLPDRGSPMILRPFLLNWIIENRSKFHFAIKHQSKLRA